MAPPTRSIVFLTPYYPPFTVGGAERTTSLHARILKDLGYSIVIATPDYGGTGGTESKDGMEVIRFPLCKLEGDGTHVPDGLFRSAAVQRGVAESLSATLKGRDLYCVHAQNIQLLEAGADLARRLAVPLVAHLRDTALLCALGGPYLMTDAGRDDTPPANFRQQVRHYLRYQVPLYTPDAGWGQRLNGIIDLWKHHRLLQHNRRRIRSAARVVFASQGLLDLYGRCPGVGDSARFRVAYAPVLKDPQPSVEPLPEAVAAVVDAGHPFMLYVGKVSKGKGADVMFAAHRKLLESVPEARLVIAGNVHGDWDLVPDRTVLTGFVSQQVVQSLYAACDLVLVPSTWPEPLGWGTLDSGRHNKPTVATRVGGIPEAILHEQTGLLVERGDANAMAAAMQRLIGSRDLCVTYGAAAREHVRERFGAVSVGRQLASVYEGL